MMGNYHVRCGVGEKMEIISKSYLSLYFAPLAAKSLGYTSCKGSRWANGNNSTGFLALYKVATGTNPYFVEFSESDLDWEILQQRCPGALCTWAKAGRALYNDEVIIYRDFQSTVEFLVELSV